MGIFVKSLEEMEELNKIINENDAMQLPLVSICSITYNHAPYIRQCLDGFLMQNTNFKYEIIIHDDASTDGTAEIIKEYAEKYPDLITPIFQSENQYSKGLRGFYAKFVFPKAKGKYIAMCEGDDYWTDPLKLQKQVDFLETNPEFVMCTHNYYEYIQINDKIKENEKVGSTVLDLNTLIHFSFYYFQPVTLLFRNSIFNVDEYSKYKTTRDTAHFYYLLTKGKGYYFNDIMAVYRRHTGGVWTGCNRIQQWLSDYGVRMSIYQKEQTSDAVIFLINLLYENISRFWLAKNPIIVNSILKIIIKHFGYRFAFKCILRRFIGLKNPFYDKIKSVETFHQNQI